MDLYRPVQRTCLKIPSHRIQLKAVQTRSQPRSSTSAGGFAMSGARRRAEATASRWALEISCQRVEQHSPK